MELRFVGASAAPVLEPEGLQAHRTNYFRSGEDNYADIPNFSRVTYRRLYEGVDLVFYGQGGRVEYDLTLQPRADPRRIRLQVKGAQKLEIDSDGDLLIHAGHGTFRQHKPRVYQERVGVREPVQAAYRLRGSYVELALGRYDAGKPLTIDPVLSYSTYLGGTLSDEARAIASDAAGNVYLTGATSSADYPVLGAFQSARAGDQDLFVTKLNAQGSGIVYSTYVGGRRSGSGGSAIAVDAAGNAYVAGSMTGSSYPVTSARLADCVSGVINGVVTKLNAAGNALVYSTCVPYAQVRSGALDASGNFYLTGTADPTFATTPGSFQAVHPGPNAAAGFVAKLNATGTAMQYATFLSGTVQQTTLMGIAVDPAGNAYVVGDVSTPDFPMTAGAFQTWRGRGIDMVVAKLNPSGSQLVYSTYLGGNSDEQAGAIAVDSTGRAYVGGYTLSTDFPGLPFAAFGSYRGMLSILAPDGSKLISSRYFVAGGLQSEVRAIAVDPSGTYIHAAGYIDASFASDVDPVQVGQIGDFGAYAVKWALDPATNQHTVVYSTPLGGTNWVNGLAVDRQGNLHMTGYAGATLIPVLPVTSGALRLKPAGDTDTFVAKLSTLGRPIALDGGCGAARGAAVQLRAFTALDAAGTVTFKEGDVALATVAIANGMASYSAPASVGVHQYTAVRSNDGATSLPVYCKVDQ